MSLLTRFLEVLVPLLVAIDPLGMIPILLGLTAPLPEIRRRRVILQAVVTAFIIAGSFIFLGSAIFRFLAISPSDFRISGGILLLVLAVLDLVQSGKPSLTPTEEIDGIVPLGMPLIAGPATLTTVLVLSTNPRYGYWLTMAAVLVAFGILHVVMLLAQRIARYVGQGALKALSKLVMVLLAAIAVNFIRSGITEALAGR